MIKLLSLQGKGKRELDGDGGVSPIEVKNCKQKVGTISIYTFD